MIFCIILRLKTSHNYNLIGSLLAHFFISTSIFLARKFKAFREQSQIPEVSFNLISKLAFLVLTSLERGKQDACSSVIINYFYSNLRRFDNLFDVFWRSVRLSNTFDNRFILTSLSGRREEPKTSAHRVHR